MTHRNPDAEATNLTSVSQPLHLVPSVHGLAVSRDTLLRSGAVLGLAALTVAVYTGLAWRTAGTVGFPLDDAWIHQTYARNLAHSGEWAFSRDTASAGSTAPLWTIILSGAFLLPGNPQLWTYVFGACFYAGTAWMGYRLSRVLFDDERLAWATAVVLLAEWHLAWAGVSGMELPLYTFLTLWLFVAYFEQESLPHPISWGILAGLLTLTRPEGVWLVALVGCHMVITRRWTGLTSLAWFGTAWSLVVAPYVIYNWTATGHLFPNTFYAKQQEYAILTEQVPVWRRLLREAWLPLIGAQVLLVPGLVWVLWRRSSRVSVLPLVWAAGLIAVYAVRLPVTYQHGRYVMPVIPILLIYGLGGMRVLLRSLPRIPARVWSVSLLLLFAGFWGRGAVAYAEDTSIITCEMVATAEWLDHNTPADALVAAHDIGAIGYFTRRPLLDLAGLVSPEVIPIVRDEAALADYIRARNAGYLVTFPDWYPALVQQPWVERVYRRSCVRTRETGRRSMTVYRIAAP